MKVKIDRDERWPEYIVQDSADPNSWGFSVEIPDALFKRYNKVMKEFEAVQDLLSKAYRNEG